MDEWINTKRFISAYYDNKTVEVNINYFPTVTILTFKLSYYSVGCFANIIWFSSHRQVQMYNVVIPLTVGLLHSAFPIHPLSSNPASSVLVFFFLSFTSFSFSLIVLSIESPLSFCPIQSLCLLFSYSARQCSFFSNRFQHFICFVFCSADFLYFFSMSTL